MIAWTFYKHIIFKALLLSLSLSHHLSVFLPIHFTIFLDDCALIATDKNKRWKYNHVWGKFIHTFSEWIKNRLKYKVNIKITKNQYRKLQSNKCVYTHCTGWENESKKNDDSLCYLWNVNDVLYSICTVLIFQSLFK